MDLMDRTMNDGDTGLSRTRHRRRGNIVGAFLALAAMTFSVSAHEFVVSDLTINHPWSRQTPPMAPVGVAYLTITNKGSEPDRLIGGSSTVSEGFEIHTSESQGGVARMRRLAEGVLIEPGTTIELKPMGTHIMLTGLKVPIKADEAFSGTLVFERAGTLDVTFAVQGLSARVPTANDHQGHTQ
ncbi:copper chaperone PCu(A)C [Aureimonas altamirensis]|uniref:copper chaperone PCu(A)C n=1 Tax=Aureimonas altamirensis TaxID=370622 RepID=UPI0020370710|nr:copper chaperone PCu(A)C [Aureimonas altamirensis]MCM2505699.1 copper chaperone PCu(A)C [Aureimonas altamirensis]